MAEQVCADEQIPADEVLDLLAALIDKSLVSLDGELAGDARYRLLDTIGEYAAGRLAASGEQADDPGRAPRLPAGAWPRTSWRAAFLRGDPPWPERVAMYRRIDSSCPTSAPPWPQCLSHGDAEQGLRLCLRAAQRRGWPTATSPRAPAGSTGSWP